MNIKVRLKAAVDRFPHFLANAGLTGTLIECTDKCATIKMDEHLNGAEEWDNCIHFYGMNGSVGDQLNECVETLDGTEIKVITKGTQLLIEAEVNNVEEEGTLKVTMPYVSSAGLHSEQVVVGVPTSCIKYKTQISTKFLVVMIKNNKIEQQDGADKKWDAAVLGKNMVIHEKVDHALIRDMLYSNSYYNHGDWAIQIVSANR